MCEALEVLKPVEHQQISESIEGILTKDSESSVTKNEINEIKKLEEQINKNSFIYK